MTRSSAGNKLKEKMMTIRMIPTRMIVVRLMLEVMKS
jgi:hypothetical protein